VNNRSCHGNPLLIDLQRSYLNICYFYQDLQQRLLHPRSLSGLFRNLRTFLLTGQYKNYAQWSSISTPFERHPFSGLIHSAGELLHRFVHPIFIEKKKNRIFKALQSSITLIILFEALLSKRVRLYLKHIASWS